MHVPTERAGSALDPNSEAFNIAFDQAFGLVAFAMNRHLMDHMLRAMRELEVDFESLVLWGLLSHLNVAHLLLPGTGPDILLDERGRLKETADRLRPMRLRDLEQVSRLPRETVRRKLLGLKERGYVVQVDGGWLFNRERVDPSLREFNRETARRTLRLAEEMGRLLTQGLARAGEPGDAAPGPEGAAK